MIEVKNDDFSSLGLNDIFVCPTHKQRYNTLFLEESENEISPLRCTKCQTTKRLDSSKILSIEEILESNEGTIFDNWPLFGEKNDFFKLIQETPFVNFDEVSLFFKGLRSSFLEKIDSIEEKLQCQYKLIEDNKNLLSSYYNSVSFKDKLQISIKEYKVNTDKSIQELNKCIQQAAVERNQVEANISHIHKSLCYYKDYLSVSSLQTFQNGIKDTLNQMEKIIDYQIYPLLENKDTKVVTLPQKQQFKNNVYFGQNSFQYNLYTKEDQINYTGCILSVYKNQNCICTYCRRQHHQQNNKNSYENLKKLKIIV